MVYKELWIEIAKEFETIDTTQAFLSEMKKVGVQSLFIDPWHYSGDGAEIVARVVAERVSKGL